MGRVGWYRRRDGSVDLGLSNSDRACAWSIFLDRMFDRLKGLHLGGTCLSAFEALVDSRSKHDQKSRARNDLFPRQVCLRMAWQRSRRFRDRLRRDQAANIAALTTAIGRGPCERLDAGIRFQPHRARAASGFA